MHREINQFAWCVGLGATLMVGCNGPDFDPIDLSRATDSLEIFAPDFISTGMYERDIAISPDGIEIIFTLGNYKQSHRCLVSTDKRSGQWSAPEILEFSGKYQDIEPFFADAGDRLLFASDRPMNDEIESKDYNIWYCHRIGGKWNEPVAFGPNINTENDEFYPSLTNSGNLYFTSTNENGIGKEDIYLAKWLDGTYQDPIALDSNVNSSFYEFNAFISPEEDLLIFSSYGRPDGLGGGDLYYSIKSEDGHWSKSKNLGPTVNSKSLDYCPFVDFVRGKLYFTSERTSAQSEIQSIEKFRLNSNAPGNGMGDIYCIDLELLGLER